jgi:transcriptional regulator with XRE-family HTH domain
MDFSDWLLEQMNQREWTQSDLSKKSGLTRQSVSDYVNRRRTNPEPAALVAIANALGISPITVFRKAGLLPSSTESDSDFDDWKHLLNQLPPDEREEMRGIVQLKIEKRQKAEAVERAGQFKPGNLPK